MFGLVDDLLLEGEGLGSGFLAKAFHQLLLGFFGGEGGYFFQAADMLFLVFFEFCTLQVIYFYLTIEIFFDEFIFFALFFQLLNFCRYALFLLACPVLCFADLPVFFNST